MYILLPLEHSFPAELKSQTVIVKLEGGRSSMGNCALLCVNCWHQLLCCFCGAVIRIRIRINMTICGPAMIILGIVYQPTDTAALPANRIKAVKHRLSFMCTNSDLVKRQLQWLSADRVEKALLY